MGNGATRVSKVPSAGPASAVSSKLRANPAAATAKESKATALNATADAGDWSKRPAEDSPGSGSGDQKILENLSRIGFRVQATAPSINKHAKALETLRNRQKELQLDKDAERRQQQHSDRLSIEQIQEMYGYHCADANKWNARQLSSMFKLNLERTEMLLKVNNIYSTIGAAKTGFYGNWAIAGQSLQQHDPLAKEAAVREMNAPVDRQAPSDLNVPLWHREDRK